MGARAPVKVEKKEEDIPPTPQIDYSEQFGSLETKVVEWQKNGGDWWRDTEFMCPATLRAVCNLQTMVKEYEEKMGKMGKRIEDQNIEIKELKEKVTTLMAAKYPKSKLFRAVVLPTVAS